jgi:hypothetical protein
MNAQIKLPPIGHFYIEIQLFNCCLTNFVIL